MLAPVAASGPGRAGDEPVAMMILSNCSVSLAVRTARALLHLQRGRVHKARLALDVGDLALLGHHAQAAGQLGHHAFLEGAQFGHVDLRLAKFHAPIRRVLAFGDQRRHVQQRLGRNAAAIQANSAGVLFKIDEGDVKAKVGAEESSGVTAGSAANHCNFYVRVRHVSLPDFVSG